MYRIFSAAAVAISLTGLGCGSDTVPVLTEEPPALPGGHAHPDEGPHHGHLIELGQEEFHAELLHDDKSEKVTIYVLDSSATKEVKISDTEMSLNAVVGGQPKQFKLLAVDSGDGGASQFEIVDKELLEALEHGESTNARLSLSIAGKPYTGKIEHHAHDDHDHQH